MSSEVKIDMSESTHPVLRAAYYFFALTNLMGNVACLSVVACVNIMGTSLGLRGPDGSVRQAADNMHKQTPGLTKLPKASKTPFERLSNAEPRRKRVFWFFGSSLVACSGVPCHQRRTRGARFWPRP